MDNGRGIGEGGGVGAASGVADDWGPAGSIAVEALEVRTVPRCVPDYAAIT
jgi:hypothetical protein